MKLLLSPHNDDSVLFSSFVLQREHPVVLTVYDSFVQPSRGYALCDAETRRKEDIAAVRDVVGCVIQFAGLSDAECDTGALISALTRWHSATHPVTEVWLPAVETGGHQQHNLVGNVGAQIFSEAKIHRYLTYTTRGKSTWGKLVPCTGAMILKKLQALACYKTQIEIEALGCWPHFLRSQEEYMAE